MPRAAAIRGNVHERNRLAGLSEVYKPDMRYSPARVRITRLPVQFRKTGFFPLFHLPPRYTSYLLRELAELPEEGEWRNKVRPVASLFLSHRMPLDTVAVAFAAYFDFLRGLESGWNQDVVLSSRRRVSCLDCLNLDLVSTIMRERLSRLCNFRFPERFCKNKYFKSSKTK